MKPQDLFGVILRTFGLWLVIWGSWNTLAGLKYLATTITAAIAGVRSHYDPLSYFVYGLPALLAGISFLTFADAFVRFTYPTSKPPPLPKEAASPATEGSSSESTVAP